VNGRTHRLPRKARLANKRDFAAVLKQPQHRVQRQGVELLVVRNRRQEARLGVIVGRDYDRRSTQRHRFKRLVREGFRRRRHALAGFDVLVRARSRKKNRRSGPSQPLCPEIEGLYDEVLSRLGGPQGGQPQLAQQPSLAARSVLALFRAYQLILSPLLGQRCRFYPSCSSYATQAVRGHGVIRGLALTVRRLAKCHPWHPGGVDLVPEPNRSA